jgi:N-acetylglucosaminyldiphosphoundecaprenol N-acetyl-beta-D-mannosaminyltransferase
LKFESGLPSYIRVLGTPISIVTVDRVLAIFETWLKDRSDRFVVFRDVHGVMRARRDPKLEVAHARADLVAPDGMPLVWFAKLAGVESISRVSGPDTLAAVCEYGLSRGWRHFFYGSSPKVSEQLIEVLKAKYPTIVICGSYSPPFSALTPEENRAIYARIAGTNPDFVWVGLGTPKQEIWMNEARGQLGGAILLGVGAAFDVHAGEIPRAPKWMQANGLEWLFRLVQEPARLWRRYLILAPQFIALASLQLTGELIGRIRGRKRG